MKNKEYLNLVEKLSKNNKYENINGLNIIVKEIPDVDKDGVLDPRVYKEKMKHKKAIVDSNNYMYKNIPVGTMRRGMGWPNIDISKDIIKTSKEIDGVKVRVYTPGNNTNNRKCMIFIHGGGFFGGDLDVVENPCKAIADKANTVVISVDYRLAPENPFPSGLDDCFKVVKYVYNNSHEFNIDKEKITIAGDSAGGNIAAVCALRDRDLNMKIIKYTALIYPVVTLSNEENEYYKWNIDEYKISEDKEILERVIKSLKGTIEIVNTLYLQENISSDNFEVSPLLIDNLRGLGKTLVVTAEYDFLRIQGEEYAKRLCNDGIEIRTIRYKGMDHAFLDKCGYYPQAEDCINEIVKDINSI